MKELFAKQLEGAVQSPLGKQVPPCSFFGTQITENDKVLYAAYVEWVTMPIDPNDQTKAANVPISLFIPVLESDFDVLDKMFVSFDIKKGVTNETMLKQLSALDGFPFFTSRCRQLANGVQNG